MAEGVLIYGDSATHPDQLAASRFLAGDAFVYLEIGGRRIVACTDFESGRARAESGADEIWGYESLGVSELFVADKGEGWIDGELTLRAARRAGLDVATVPGWFPLGVAEHLRAGGITVRIDEGLFLARRRTKDAYAIQATREVTALVEQSMSLVRARLAAAEIAPDGALRDSDGGPLTSERLHGALRVFWAENGLEGETPIIAGGARSADPHDVGAGPLRAGEAIICDLFPRSVRTRYHGDMTRTYCVGEPPAELVELHATVERALEAALAAIRPGIPGRAVNDLVCDLFEQAGYPTTRSVPGVDPTSIARYNHGLGHGVGLAVHEAPSLGRSGGSPLAPGDLVTVEPGLYREGFGGVRIEEMVLVTEDGCENLNRLDRSLSVIA